MRGRSVKLLPLSFRTYSRQLTPPSLFSAPKTSFGSGTTTSSTFLENCFTSTCFGASAAWAQSDKCGQEAAGQFGNFSKWDHRELSTVDFAFVFRING